MLGNLICVIVLCYFCVLLFVCGFYPIYGVYLMEINEKLCKNHKF